MRIDERKVLVVEGSATYAIKPGEASIAEIEVSINDEKALLESKHCWKKDRALQIMQNVSTLHVKNSYS